MPSPSAPAPWRHPSTSGWLRLIAAAILTAIAIASLLTVTRADAQVGGNEPPVATDDTATGSEDAATAITIDVLANDTDADGDRLTLFSVTDPAHGTAAITGDRIDYSPDAGFAGTDTFTYIVDDGRGGQDTATVTVTVTPVNDPPTAANDTAATTAGTAVSIDPLGNDSDPDGDTLVVASVGAPAHGTAIVTPAGTIAYTPSAGFTGTDTFTYVVSDGHGGTATASITVEVSAAMNVAPVAVDDSVTTPQDTAATIAVLANDTDADGDTLALLSTSAPAHGTAVVNAGGTVTYTPAAGFTGTDTFTYVVSDGQGHTDAATVTVTIQADDDEDGSGNARELKERCKEGGWQGMDFPNQGLCVAFYARMIGGNDRNDEPHGWQRILAKWRAESADDHDDDADGWKDRWQDHRDKDHHRGHDKRADWDREHDDD